MDTSLLLPVLFKETKLCSNFLIYVGRHFINYKFINFYFQTFMFSTSSETGRETLSHALVLSFCFMLTLSTLLC